MKNRFLTIFTAAFTLFCTNYVQAETQILTSIRPLYFLIEGVNQGINDHELLVDAPISPHDYQPKPSDIQKIKNAEIIFRISEMFQPRFARIFGANSKNAPIISLAEIPHLKTQPTEAHIEDEHEEEAEHEKEAEHHTDEEHGHSHSQGNLDLHIWLSPDNAMLITDHVALELSKIDPNNREKYQYNAKIQNEQLQLLDQRLHQKLAHHKDKYFFSFHDAYSHFTDGFGLNRSVALTPKRHQISAQKMRNLIALAQEKNVKCIMLEPQLSDKIAKTIVKTKNDIKIETWDPLGFKLGLNATSYYKLLTQMSDNLTKCLS